jgi:peptide/nickel transport system permease protein
VCMVLFATLDSVHFQPTHYSVMGYQVEVVSGLDLVLAPRIWQDELTYSAPFSSHSYTKMVSYDKRKKQLIQQYQPLRYVLAPQQRTLGHLLATLGWAGLGALVSGLCLLFCGVFILGRGRIVPGWRRWVQLGAQDAAWRSFQRSVVVFLVGMWWLALVFMDYHIWGTDQVGHDVFCQGLKGIRTGMLIGSITMMFSVPFALSLGMAAGFFGKRVDDVIQYIYITLSAMPSILLISAIMLVVDITLTNHQNLLPSLVERADMRLLLLCLVLGLTGWTPLCRLLRGQTMMLRTLDYVQASRLMGRSQVGIICQHIVPNVMHLVIINMVLDFSGLVLAEAVLTYIGVGVDPTMSSWGNMINAARMELAREPVVWWPFCMAFIFMFALVFSINVIADALGRKD